MPAPQTLRDPLTYQHCPGSGIGPWFYTGPAAKTGEVWAWPGHQCTVLYWDEGRNTYADTVRGSLAEGEVVGIHGFRWTVRWSDAARAQIARENACRAADAKRRAA